MEIKLTPMMEQWHSCKKAAKGALLLFRLGDFYEAFEEDAEVISSALDLTLTKRQGTPMCGVPHHTLDTYIDRLIAKGFRVAIAEQMEDPSQTKGIVRREITRFITPGTLIQSTLLPEKGNNYLVAITQVGSIYGLAACDLSTGELKVTEIDEPRELMSELYRLQMSELLIPRKFKEKNEKLLAELVALISPLEEWHFDHERTTSFLTSHFKVAYLDGFGVKGMVAAINAAGALLSYLEMELSLPTKHIVKLSPYFLKESLSIDRISQRNLELTALLEVLDKTVTPMGGRLLGRWLKNPSRIANVIWQRHEGIEALLATLNLGKIRRLLTPIRDLERLMMRISSACATARDLIQLRHSLVGLPELKTELTKVGSSLIVEATAQLHDMSELTDLIGRALVEEPPLRIGEAPLFRQGYSEPLDELMLLCRDGKEWIASYQNKVREETGIKTLKVGYNRVFGYYIEVSKGQAGAMPPTFHRKQTVANAERYISPALKEYEYKVLSADEKRQALEGELFSELCTLVSNFSSRIQAIASSIALIDTLASLAEVARQRGYVRPLVDESTTLTIIEGRHPVVETMLPAQQFIPNDTHLEGLMLITGPNMAGKSTYIRQVALLVIMAHMCSFVPAKKAHIGLVDKIFTRIGANDDLARGQSTFMVEMSETAHILNNTTERSLVILDEIGRGTSTYDGLSIAWAVAEYLLETVGKQAKTLFATHYFELTALEKSFPKAHNYHAAVKEWSDEILFLHKILPGKADRSYGIHVARLAGLPPPVIARALTLLQTLEQRRKERPDKKLPFPREEQLSLF